ncbi:hypothetical protein PAECIP111891_00258 [Paenibacillus allorhizoplanae]|uniref:Uncharacterized protein n=1 Tax=Paenibacillus allorhizoplanae TaxID=2905648 RepID=A0ABN8FUP0_9BACL|nr:hypothetical protein PAECIP111891_00258 [Paenibacillus allorhizoplanae]
MEVTLVFNVKSLEFSGSHEVTTAAWDMLNIM